MTNLTRVALVFGGRSSEHSISCATAGGVLSAIDRSKFEVIPIGITRDGAFVLEQDDSQKFKLDPKALPEVQDNGTRIQFPSSTNSREMRVIEADGSSRSLGNVDVVFPILHGRFGEDGTLQGILELTDTPYVGNGVLASALAMDKHFTKSVLSQAGIPVAPWFTVSAANWKTDAAQFRRQAEAFGLPCFVKPARAGSSVGVSRVDDWSKFSEAVEEALQEDKNVLVEQAIVGREIECGVLSGRAGGATRASVAGEVIVRTGGFYDFASKYLDTPGIELVCPANLTSPELEQLQDLATRAFDAIDGSGLARVDFFLTETGFVLNEINTLPGFTPISMFPKCWIESGFTYQELITELIELGLETVR
ncbi:MAG: D-alanine--D-alanine ligase [Microbacteriaceae bacterium]|nr:D-alanine--D-alanine ligase [Microbacteriaceae bacterium]